MTDSRYWWWGPTSPYENIQETLQPLAPARITLTTWKQTCQRIGGCVTNPQLDHKCVYCGNQP